MSRSDPSLNPFDKLLIDFQNAHAKFDDRLFFLIAVTRSELEAMDEAERDSFESHGSYLGFVITDQDESGSVTTGYEIYGSIRRHRFGRWMERDTTAFDCFKELAGRAGASLPVSILDSMPYEPTGAVALWLNYMWFLSPPSEDDLLPPDGVSKRCRAIWADPFRESAEAIQRGGLCTVETLVDGKAEAGRKRETAKPKRCNRGAKGPTPEEEKRENRIFDGWLESGYRNKADYAQDISEPADEVKHIIDRVRKRREKHSR